MSFRRYTLFVAVMMIFALMCSSIVVVADDYDTSDSSKNATLLISRSGDRSSAKSESQPQSFTQITQVAQTKATTAQTTATTAQSTEATAPATTAPATAATVAKTATTAQTTAQAKSQPSVIATKALTTATADTSDQLPSADPIPAAPVAVETAAVATVTPISTPVPKEASAAKILSKDGQADGIDISSASAGLIRVMFASSTGKKVKVIVDKGSSSYIYDLANDGTYESFSLQSGDGEYSIRIMENTRDNYYRQMAKMTISVDIDDIEDVFLNSVQNVDWDDSYNVIAKAAELVKGAKTDEERVSRIYKYIISNYTFDFDKLKKLTAEYLPDIESVLALRKGICYDFSSLFASMLRSVGIPTKLVMGMSSNAVGYHAWNEVYLKSSGKWVIIDTTCDAQLNAAGKDIKSMYKPSGSYVVDKSF